MCFFYNDLTIEDLFYCALTRSKLVCFPANSPSILCLESVEGNSELDFAGIADWADGMRVLTLPEVTFLW